MKDLVGGILTAPEASGSGHLSLGDAVEKKTWMGLVKCCFYKKPLPFFCK
jgi:hypothetical protein